MYGESLINRIRPVKGGSNSDNSAVEQLLNRSDPEGLRFLTRITVWGHWAGLAVFQYEIAHHIGEEFAEYLFYAVLVFTLAGINGSLHYRLSTNRALTRSWLLILFSLDAALVSAWLALSGGAEHPFIYLFYYPVLAGFAITLGSLRHSMAMVTAVAAVYAVISLTVGDGIDFTADQQKAVLARIAVMFAVVASVNLATRFERVRRIQAVEHERDLEREHNELYYAHQREWIELSHTIHDSAAQSAYMIGLGIERAQALSGDANPELAATLEETSRLSKSTHWDLRHPIHLGSIYEGRGLGSAIRSHVTSFTNVSGVPADVTVAEVELPLPVETKSTLFSIAHNALTNAFRHANASRVAVDLEFGKESIRLCVSDNGIGLPDDYWESGSGFASMSSAAERLGGRLVVEKRGAMGGASVTCELPMEQGRGECGHGNE